MAVRGGRCVVTTNLIVAETYALLLSRTGRPAALAFLRAVRKPPNEVVTSTPELEDRAITHWLERQWPGFGNQDLAISFTDAVSREVMAEREIHEVLSLSGFTGWWGAGVVVEP